MTDRKFEEITLKHGQELLAKELAIEPEQIILIDQVHENMVVEAKVGVLKKADAVATNKPGLCLVVRVADCVPILLFDPKKRAIAVVHAGWRGSIQNISVKTLQFMQDKYKINPRDVEVGIGPSIGPCCFEVKEDVANQFKPKYRTMEKTIDLWQVNYDQIRRMGIKKENINIAKICTKCNPDQYFSYRASGNSTCFAVGIMLL